MAEKGFLKTLLNKVVVFKEKDERFGLIDRLQISFRAPQPRPFESGPALSTTSDLGLDYNRPIRRTYDAWRWERPGMEFTLWMTGYRRGTMTVAWNVLKAVRSALPDGVRRRQPRVLRGRDNFVDPATMPLKEVQSRVVRHVVDTVRELTAEYERVNSSVFGRNVAGSSRVSVDHFELCWDAHAREGATLAPFSLWPSWRRVFPVAEVAYYNDDDPSGGGVHVPAPDGEFGTLSSNGVLKGRRRVASKDPDAAGSGPISKLYPKAPEVLRYEVQIGKRDPVYKLRTGALESRMALLKELRRVGGLVYPWVLEVQRDFEREKGAVVDLVGFFALAFCSKRVERRNAKEIVDQLYASGTLRGNSKLPIIKRLLGVGILCRTPGMRGIFVLNDDFRAICRVAATLRGMGVDEVAGAHTSARRASGKRSESARRRTQAGS